MIRHKKLCKTHTHKTPCAYMSIYVHQKSQQHSRIIKTWGHTKDMTHKLTQVVIKNVDLKQTRDNPQSRCVKTDHVNTCTAPPTRCGNHTEQLHWRVSRTDRADTSAALLFTRRIGWYFLKKLMWFVPLDVRGKCFLKTNVGETVREEGTNPYLKRGQRNSA